MEYHNAVNPTDEQIQGLLAPGDDGPIYMVNLLKFRERAEYADGREDELSGREAYARYSEGVLQTLAAVGGCAVFAGDVTRLMLGEVEELWDEVAIAMYPNRAAMLEMIQNPAYQAIHVHREAGLAGQLNIETRASFLPAGLDGQG